jgi:hypothetical protein
MRPLIVTVRFRDRVALALSALDLAETVTPEKELGRWVVLTTDHHALAFDVIDGKPRNPRPAVVQRATRLSLLVARRAAVQYGARPAGAAKAMQVRHAFNIVREELRHTLEVLPRAQLRSDPPQLPLPF